MTKTFNILQKVRKRWEMEETALIWRWLPAFPCGKACAAAPAEPRNDKSGNLPLPEGRRDKLACASHPCHCEEAEGRRGNLGKAVTNSPEAFLRFGCILRDCRALLRKARNDKSGNLPRPGRGAGWKAGHLHSPVESHRGMGKMRAFFCIFLHFLHAPRMRLHPAPKNRGWVTDFADQISR